MWSACLDWLSTWTAQLIPNYSRLKIENVAVALNRNFACHFFNNLVGSYSLYPHPCGMTMARAEWRPGSPRNQAGSSCYNAGKHHVCQKKRTDNKGERWYFKYWSMADIWPNVCCRAVRDACSAAPSRSFCVSPASERRRHSQSLRHFTSSNFMHAQTETLARARYDEQLALQ